MAGPVEVFISYARPDRGLVETIAEAIKARGLGVWWDVPSVRAGQDYEALIRRALQRVRCAVVLWTSASVSTDHEWVRAEARRAAARDILVPALLVDPDDVPLPFNLRLGVDMRGWSGEPTAPELAALVDQVQRCVDATPAVPDDFDPSADELRAETDAALWAQTRVAAIAQELGTALPALRQQRDARAALQLDAVLDEVHATVRAVNEAVSAFLRPALGGLSIDATPEPYLQLATQDLLTVIEEGRGHCGDIAGIYFGPDFHRTGQPGHPGSLHDWVHEHLSADGASRLDQVFYELVQADQDLFAEMARVGGQLSATARNVVKLLAHARPDDARALVVESLGVLHPLQDALARDMATLRGLQAEVRRSVA